LQTSTEPGFSIRLTVSSVIGSISGLIFPDSSSDPITCSRLILTSVFRIKREEKNFVNERPHLFVPSLLTPGPGHRKLTIPAGALVQVPPHDLVRQHVGCLVDPCHQRFKLRPLRRHVFVGLELLPHLQPGDLHRVVVPLEELDPRSIQSSESRQNTGTSDDGAGRHGKPLLRLDDNESGAGAKDTLSAQFSLRLRRKKPFWWFPLNAQNRKVGRKCFVTQELLSSASRIWENRLMILTC
jgi:hypothetical protein